MYQKIEIIGNLGRDPEMRFTPTGQAVTNFTVATTETYKDNKKTVWFRVTVWGNQAEACNQYLVKGSKVFVEGRLITDDDGNIKVFEKKDRDWAANFEINARQVVFLSPKSDQGDQDSDFMVD